MLCCAQDHAVTGERYLAAGRHPDPGRAVSSL